MLLTGCCQQGSTISIPDARQRAAQPGRPNHDRRTRLLHPPDVARADRALDAGGGGPALPHRNPGLWHDHEGAGVSGDQSDGQGVALRHGETVVTETAAICAYLADAFPEAGLAPSHGSRLRGSLLQLAVLRCGSGRLRSMTGDALRPPVSMPVRSVERLRAICLALPAAVEKETWGDPTFRVEVVRQSRSSAGPASVMINVAKSSAGSEREQRSPRWRASSIPVVRPSCACGTQCLRLDEVTTFSSG